MRTHSADPRFPDNGYTTQYNIDGTKKYHLPDYSSPGEFMGGKWIRLNKNTPEVDIKRIHIPAGNVPTGPEVGSRKMIGFTKAITLNVFEAELDP